MKIAVSAQGKTLESEIDPRFGRCNYFLFIDTDTMEFEAIANEAGQAMGGAGVRAAQLVADKRVEAVITGNCGPNAFQTLKAAGIKVFTGAQGMVKTAIEKYKTRELNESTDSTVPPHFGIR